MFTFIKSFLQSPLLVIKSLCTAPDGESWAPGRIMALGVFIVSQCLVIRATQQLLAKGQLTVADWQSFFGGVSAFEAAICATAVGLILGGAPADSGGKWWGKDASPPPPPTDTPPDDVSTKGKS